MLSVIIGFVSFTFGFLLASIMSGASRTDMCEECRRTKKQIKMHE